MIKAIIFDFDMTLVDSLELGNKAIKDMEIEHGISAKGISAKEIWGNLPHVFAKKLAEVNKHKLPWEEIREINMAALQKHYTNCRLNAIEFLKELIGKKIKLGIISNNSIDVINTVLENKQNQGVKFDIVFGYQNIAEGKSKSDLLDDCLKLFGVKNNELMYVGDHVNDIIAAKKASVVSAAVASGLHTLEELKKENPDILVNKLGELGKHIF